MNYCKGEYTALVKNGRLKEALKMIERDRKKRWDEYFAHWKESCGIEDLIGGVEPRAPHPMPTDLIQKWVDCQNIDTNSSENVSIEITTDNGPSKESNPTEGTENETDNLSDAETHSTNFFTSKTSAGYILSQTRQRGAKKLYTATDSPVELSSNTSSTKELTRKNINQNTVTMTNETPRGSPAFRHRISRFRSDTRRSNFTVCPIERTNLTISDDPINSSKTCSKSTTGDILNPVTPKTNHSKSLSNSKSSMGLKLSATSLQLKDDNPQNKSLRPKSPLSSDIDNSNSPSTKKILRKSFLNEHKSVKDVKSTDSTCPTGKTTSNPSKSDEPQPKKKSEESLTDRSNKKLLNNNANRPSKLFSHKSSFKKEEKKQDEKRQKSGAMFAAIELKKETDNRTTKSLRKRTKKKKDELTEQSSEENLLDVQYSTMRIKNERKYCTFSSSDSESDNCRHRQTKITKAVVNMKRVTKLESQLLSESDDETMGWDLKGFLENNKTFRKSIMYR